jgi:hypothetical protein
MCDGKLLGLLTVLALGPAAPGVVRAEAPAANAPARDDVRRQLGELRKELDDLRRDTARSFEAARQRIDGFRAAQQRIDRFEAALKRIDALAEQVARLRKEVDGLRRREPPLTRRAGLAPALGSAGSIRLINHYVEPVRILVNGAAYRLAPGETRLLRGQAPGGFNYEVSGITPAVERVLAANETFTIRVRLP